MKKFFENKPRAWFIVSTLVIVALLLITLITIANTKDRNVLAIVAGENITSDDLDTSLYGLNFDEEMEYDEETKRALLNRLIERKIAGLEAEKMGIEVSEIEIEEAIKSRLDNSYDTYTDAQKSQTKDVVRLSLLIEKIKSQMTSSADVTYLVARFDRGRQEYRPRWENLVAKDKVYAETVINDIYEKLINKRITLLEAKKILDEDKIVGKSAWSKPQNMLFSERMVIAGNTELYSSTNLVSDTLSMTEGVNEPNIARVIYAEDSDTMDSFYYIAFIHDLNKAEIGYEAWLENKKSEYNVRSIYE